MNSLLVRLAAFLGLGVVSFLPVVIVAYVSRHNIKTASEISITFAYVGLVYTVFYFGQRAYLSFNANDDIYEHLIFRLINIFLASLLLVLIGSFVGLPGFIITLAISIKLSEALMDLRYGYITKIKDANRASREYCITGFFRACLFFSVFLLFPNPSIHNYYFYVFAGGGLFVALLVRYVVLKDLVMSMRSYSLENYFSSLRLNFVFALSAFSCGIVIAAPRLLLAGGAGVELQAVALSLAPLLGLMFQAIWISNINKVHAGGKAILFFLAETLLLLSIIYFSSPLWGKGISIFYGDAIRGGLDLFVDVLLASAVFFSVISFLNVLKARLPMFEFFIHILGFVFYLILSGYMGKEVVFSLYATSGFMGLLLLLVFFVMRRAYEEQAGK